MTGPAPRPAWMERLRARLDDVPPEYFSAFLPRGDERASAVLMLFGPHAEGGEDVVLTERAPTLRSHAGQVSFPGGRVDPGDGGPVDAALREAAEEVGVDRATVEVVATLPELAIPASNSKVTPVVAWWSRPHPLRIASADEVARVVRVPLDHLLDPAQRYTVAHPSGYRGPAFHVDDLVVWGFTAGLLTRAFLLAGIDRPWDSSRVRELPERFGRPVLHRPAPPAPPVHEAGVVDPAAETVDEAPR